MNNSGRTARCKGENKGGLRCNNMRKIRDGYCERHREQIPVNMCGCPLKEESGYQPVAADEFPTNAVGNPYK
jgi:hypothetical protein